MLVVDLKDVSNVVIGKPPTERFCQVMLSPKLQPEVADFALGVTTVPPGSATAAHTHAQTAETFYVLEGRAEIRVGDDTVVAGPNVVVYGPPGIQHKVTNVGEDELRFMFIYSPPGEEVSLLESLDRARGKRG
jgi:mannose-6-phosphate isomerase-like protein (cupin superfamily)